MLTSVAASTLLSSGNALAATELVQIADGDTRLNLILTLFVPALAWVAFNIAGPLFRQIQVWKMCFALSVQGNLGFLLIPYPDLVHSLNLPSCSKCKTRRVWLGLPSA